MIKSHLWAIGDLFDTIDSMRNNVGKMKRCKARTLLEHQTEQLQITAEQYADQSATLYDKMLQFGLTKKQSK